MPYITETDRARLDRRSHAPAQTPGDLNYLLTVEAALYVRNNGLSYQSINDVVGALECAKAEFLRRVVADYEDLAIVRNGDVYP